MGNFKDLPKDVIELITNQLDAISFMKLYYANPKLFNKYNDFWYRRGQKDFPYIKINDPNRYINVLRKVRKVSKVLTDVIFSVYSSSLPPIGEFLGEKEFVEFYKPIINEQSFNFFSNINPQSKYIQNGKVDVKSLIEETNKDLIKYIPYFKSDIGIYGDFKKMIFFYIRKNNLSYLQKL